jgi:hypothetical protein
MLDRKVRGSGHQASFILFFRFLGNFTEAPTYTIYKSLKKFYFQIQ